MSKYEQAGGQRGGLSHLGYDLLPPGQSGRLKTNVETALDQCIRGERGWEQGFQGELAKDIDLMLSVDRLTPITRFEEDTIRLRLGIEMGASVESTSKAARWLCQTSDIAAVKSFLTDVDVYRGKITKAVTEGFDIPGIPAENKIYWMEPQIDQLVAAGNGTSPLRIWDFGAASGTVMSSIKKRHGDSINAHITDLGYGPHRKLDGVHLMCFEVAPKKLADASDVSLTVHSMRHSPFPHLAIRNILAMTRDVAYLSYGDIPGVVNTNIHLGMDGKSKTDEYMGYWGSKPNTHDLNHAVFSRIWDELSQAQERGWQVQVSRDYFNNPQDQGRFHSLQNYPRGEVIGKIIAKKS